MDKTLKIAFVEGLMREANRFADSIRNGQFIGFRVGDTHINFAAVVLPMNGNYIYCPCVPHNPAVYRDYGMSGTEICKIWSGFWERVKSEYSKNKDYHYNFSGKDKTYNWNNGKTAIVMRDKIFVCFSENVDYGKLEELGFSLDMNLFVPFSNGEAYYEPSADHGCNNCGLLSMC